MPDTEILTPSFPDNPLPFPAFPHFIGGEFTPGANGRTFPDINPATGQIIGQVALGSSEDVDAAVRAAQAALTGPWGRASVEDRCELLRRVADRIEQRLEDFVVAEVLDTGKPARAARQKEIPRAAANFRIYADLMRGSGTDCYEMATDDGHGALSYTLRVPLGVVGLIVPWNLPLLLLTWKVAPALAAGNAVVAKPSEETPATATLLAAVMAEAGIPPGVFNVVHGYGPAGVGEALARHPGIRAIAFTGECQTGQAIMAATATGLKPLSFELGGKNPALVFADANLAAAVKGTALSAFSNTGQVCLCTERVYVERPLFEAFVSELKKAAEALQPGDPFAEGTTLGPLISREHRQKVLGYYRLAEKEGARVLTGGHTPALSDPYSMGFYVSPTIWVGLPESARCVKEEVFGPVCHVQPFDSEIEAIEMANRTEFGLAAAVWTQDASRALRVAKQLHAGLTWVNCWYLRDLRTPFGGMKHSGIGREGGKHSLDFFSDLRTVTLKI